MRWSKNNLGPWALASLQSMTVFDEVLRLQYSFIPCFAACKPIFTIHFECKYKFFNCAIEWRRPLSALCHNEGNKKTVTNV